ncbi:hypothetical protein WN48_07244 [Eufriesea mexicana]|uniref:Uncharacterized protein n=1 Tax=Eufriesea mexicana TaxID=516756 RepID=A0A310SSK6_9HYME|nr:hypothetical protein WN48_07244 [Eufriesea mexicana]
MQMDLEKFRLQDGQFRDKEPQLPPPVEMEENKREEGGRKKEKPTYSCAIRIAVASKACHGWKATKAWHQNKPAAAEAAVSVERAGGKGEEKQRECLGSDKGAHEPLYATLVALLLFIVAPAVDRYGLLPSIVAVASFVLLVVSFSTSCVEPRLSLWLVSVVVSVEETV